MVRLRKMLVHRAGNGGLCVLSSGAVRPFTMVVRLTNSNGNHKHLTLLLSSDFIPYDQPLPVELNGIT